MNIKLKIKYLTLSQQFCGRNHSPTKAVAKTMKLLMTSSSTFFNLSLDQWRSEFAFLL